MPTERIHRAVAQPSVPIVLDDVRHASVAMLIDPDENLLFIQRAYRPGDPWSGQIALPGGHVEPGEGWAAAAIRETWEEIGKQVFAEQLLGTLSDLRTPAKVATLATRVVRPHVFSVSDLQLGRLEPSEVAAAHLLQLDALLAGVGRSSFELEYNGANHTLPCVDFNGQRLWGMTLWMVDDLLNRIDGAGTGLARN